jgi:acetyltransferase-like isoleucine patch superfamily enzyme
MNKPIPKAPHSESPSVQIKEHIVIPLHQGLLDRFIRRFGRFSHMVLILALYTVAAIAIALALAPSLWFLDQTWTFVSYINTWMKWPIVGFACGLAFFMSGFVLLIVVPIFNFILPTRIKSFKGGYYTYAALPWYIHNGLFYLVRYTFLPFVTLTPFSVWFLRAMGMKIGRRVFINTEFISDPCLLTVGDDAVIGGSVHMFAHYGGGGYLTIAPTIIGARATIGELATLMGDVHVGDDATIIPHSVLLPGSRVGQHETWGGVPALLISQAEMQNIKESIHRHTES